MNLRAFVDKLDQGGHLLRVTRPVEVKYEISTVIKRLDGRPVLFENVTGFDMPVVSNVCATRDLVCLALGIERPALMDHITHAVQNPKPPETIAADDYAEIPVDLTRLPILTHYPNDGGPYIPSGIAIAVDAEYGTNASYHRAMVMDGQHLALRVVERHFHEFISRGLTRFAFCIGNPVPVLIGGAISVELGQSEVAIANALGGARVVALGEHRVPEAELILLCELTGETTAEGPFVDLTETYDIVRQQPVARVERIFARPQPLYHALLPGDLEHKTLMGMPREPTIFREVAKVCDVVDVHVTPGGCCWLHGAVKIRKRHEDDGRRAIEAAFRGHASMKHVFIVDDDIDIEDPRQMEWAMATRFQADRDLVIRPGEKGSSLDPSSDLATKKTTKVGFDLTIPAGAPREKFARALDPIEVDLGDYR